jgi:hypothetical protein
MTVRSIFDDDMSRPVMPVRPRPDEMALPEDALGKAMMAEARSNPAMRPAAWPAKSARRGDFHPCGMPANISPASLQGVIWRLLRDQGPMTMADLVAATAVQEQSIIYAIDNMRRRVHLVRQRSWMRGGTIRLGDEE